MSSFIYILLLCTVLATDIAVEVSPDGGDVCEETAMLQVGSLSSESSEWRSRRRRRRRRCTTTEAPTPAPQPGRATIPLDTVLWDSQGNQLVSFGINATPSWTVRPSLPGTPIPPQRLLLDLGSSTVGFCDTFVDNQATETTDLKICLAYGGVGTETWWGFQHKGGLDLAGNVSFDKSTWGTMTTHFNMPCKDSFQGIFGAAFQEVNFAYPQLYPLDFASTLTCPPRNLTTPATFVSEVRQTYGNLFGLGWTGIIGDDTAALHLGAAATDNSFYNGGQSSGKAKILPGGLYIVNITQYSFNGLVVPLECTPVSGAKVCFIDSGNPRLSFPKSIHDAMKDQGSGTVNIELDGPEGPVVLDLDVASLLALGFTDGGGGGVLGLPAFLYQYFLFDINEDAPTVEFFQQPVPVSNAMVVGSVAGGVGRWPAGRWPGIKRSGP